MANQKVAATYPDLAGNVALVTGGSGGIDSATCRALAASCVRVAVNGRRVEPVQTVGGAITRDGGDAVGVPGDGSDAGDVYVIFAATQRDLGPVDIVRAFAGGGRPPQPITMASGAARQPGGAPVVYAAAKAGIVDLTQQAAKEAGPRGVRVNCIDPAALFLASDASS